MDVGFAANDGLLVVVIHDAHLRIRIVAVTEAFYVPKSILEFCKILNRFCRLRGQSKS